MPRAAAVLSAILVAVSGTAALAGLPPGGSFGDDDGNLHEGNIEAIFEAGITLGCSDEQNLYCPSQEVTRGQMASFMARAFELEPGGADHFADDDGSIHEPSINAIADVGITVGFPDGTYRATEVVTRQQMASFIAKAIPLDPVSGEVFDDVSGVHEPSINAIAKAGITIGCDPSGRLFCPVDPVRRDQMASLLARALDLDPVLVWHQQAKLPASGSQTEALGFGVDIDGDTAVVSDYPNDQVFVFVRSNGAWSQQAVLAPTDGGVSDHFGFAVSVSGDTVVIGAQHHDHVFNNSGSAYVFTRSGSTWTEQAELLPSDSKAGHVFGTSVAVEGDTAVIGALDDDLGDQAGAIYVFTRTNGTWTEQQKLLASDGAAGDFFGSEVAISGDTVVAGMRYGAAYIFQRSNPGWTEEGRLEPADDTDWFGSAVAIDGDTIVVGAPGDDGFGFDDSGAAYVFTRAGGTWTEQAKLAAIQRAPQDRFGVSVSVSGDTVVAGAGWRDGSFGNTGAAFVFSKSDSAWRSSGVLVADDASASDFFGDAVSIDDTTIVVGAVGFTGPGAAYVFVAGGGT